MSTTRKDTLNAKHFQLVISTNKAAKNAGFEIKTSTRKSDKPVIYISPVKGLPLLLLGKNNQKTVDTVEDAMSWLSGWEWFSYALLEKTTLDKDSIKDLIKQRKVLDSLQNDDEDEI